jgi:hypothetical protein
MRTVVLEKCNVVRVTKPKKLRSAETNKGETEIEQIWAGIETE